MRLFLAILLLLPSFSWGAQDIAYVLEADSGRSLVRLITQKTVCPGVRFDGKEYPMSARAKPGSARGSEFPVRVCEAVIPNGTKSILAGETALPAPVREPGRIVLIGDTGCRMKGKTFQNCDDPEKWPFKAIADAAAAFRPDLVIHAGDYLYRETPCPEGAKGCSKSPYGYGFDAWNADFFSPAKKLLLAAPWVFVRGNHESCFRAGQGWFRFLAPESFSPSRSCNEASEDASADFSAPYAVPISADEQLIVFDSSRSPDASDGKYLTEFAAVEELAKARPRSFFLSHHPVLGFSEWKSKLYGGTGNLQNAMNEALPKRLFPDGVEAAFHGHIHLFEALDFKNGYPPTFVVGNSGTSTDEALPEKLPENAEPFPGAIVGKFYSTSNFGFATLEKKKDGWLVTERDRAGKPVWACTLKGGRCREP